MSVDEAPIRNRPLLFLAIMSSAMLLMCLRRQRPGRDDRLHCLASHVRHRFARPLGDPFELVSLLGGEAHRYHKANRTPHFDIGDLRAEFNVARFDPLIAQCFVVLYSSSSRSSMYTTRSRATPRFPG